MYSFFVLGLIPGTNIQITFQMWFSFTCIVLIAIGLFVLRHLRYTVQPVLADEQSAEMTVISPTITYPEAQ